MKLIIALIMLATTSFSYAQSNIVVKCLDDAEPKFKFKSMLLMRVNDEVFYVVGKVKSLNIPNYTEEVFLKDDACIASAKCEKLELTCFHDTAPRAVFDDVRMFNYNNEEGAFVVSLRKGNVAINAATLISSSDAACIIRAVE